ncbi:MAG: hypothetical protein KDD11_19145 [Acidobacteria bacterium]|nr:hypothetical protein [Acidobacteriota bacterium]
MDTPRSRQSIRVGDQLVVLPRGVSADRWALERVSWQNPRIRAYLQCIQLLGTVLESNYAILHCSPDRLDEIWSKVRRSADTFEHQLLPLLRVPSNIPSLDQARERALDGGEMLLATTVEKLRSFPDEVPPEGLLELRKTLCTAIGQMYGYFQDTFGDIMANDPRSRYDADYFLSRRFRQDIEDAEWLHRTVAALDAYLHTLEPVRQRHLAERSQLLRRDGVMPEADEWVGTAHFLDELLSVLTPKLKEVLALHGVRFQELEILDRYASDIPAYCQVLQATYETGRETLERLAGGSAATPVESRTTASSTCGEVFSRRLAHLADRLDQPLRDLFAFVPLWLAGIGNRRALLFRAHDEG